MGADFYLQGRAQAENLEELKAELEHLREENRRLRLELAEANDLCEHLRDKLKGKGK